MRRDLFPRHAAVLGSGRHKFSKQIAYHAHNVPLEIYELRRIFTERKGKKCSTMTMCMSHYCRYIDTLMCMSCLINISRHISIAILLR